MCLLENELIVFLIVFVEIILLINIFVYIQIIVGKQMLLKISDRNSRFVLI